MKFRIQEALNEIREAKTILSNIPPKGIVWDIENSNAQPPWGSNIAPEITSLGNYFVSSVGRNLFAVFEEALDEAITYKREVTIQ